MKVATRRDRYPIVGMCNAISARGTYCVLSAGHDVATATRPAQPVHRNGRGSKFLEVIDFTSEVRGWPWPRR